MNAFVVTTSRLMNYDRLNRKNGRELSHVTRGTYIEWQAEFGYEVLIHHLCRFITKKERCRIARLASSAVAAARVYQVRA